MGEMGKGAGGHRQKLKNGTVTRGRWFSQKSDFHSKIFSAHFFYNSVFAPLHLMIYYYYSEQQKRIQPAICVWDN